MYIMLNHVSGFDAQSPWTRQTPPFFTTTAVTTEGKSD